MTLKPPKKERYVMDTIIQGLIGSGTLIIALGIYRVANGRLSSLEKKVDLNIRRDECHYAQDNLKKHIDVRIEDLKDFIQNGGEK